MASNITSIVTSAIATYARGDVEGMLSSVAEDVEYALYLEESELPFAGTSVGKDVLRTRINMMQDAFDYILFRLFPGRVVDRTMHNQVEFMYRHRASGEILDGRFRFLLTVGDAGLVTHIAEYHDAERVKAFMRLFGGASAPSEGGPELVRPREPFGDHAARLRALTDPLPEIAPAQRERATGTVEPGQSVLLGEDPNVRQPVVLRALQDDALAARHFVDLVERKDHELAPLADAGDVVPVDRDA